MVCCVLCGVRNQSKRIRRPNEYPEAPQKMLCPYCGTVSEGEYRVSYNKLCICIVTCCCKCNKSEPFIACLNCKKSVGIVTGNRCDNCNLVTSFRSQNCPSCGSRK